MIIPERLWRPAPKDLQADFNPQAFLFRITANSVGATLLTGMGPGYQPGPNVPADKVLIVQGITGAYTSGGAETVLQMSLLIYDLNSTNILSRLAFRSAPADYAAAPAQGVFVEYRGNPFVFSDRQMNIVAQGQKSAGAVNASLELSVLGVLIPRGNWQLP